MLLGIDATNWVHQLYHANRGLNVLVSAVTRARALVEHVRPADVVACFDCRSFRHDLLPTYKESRKQKESALVDYLHAAPRAFGEVATVVQAEGFEADDCLATLAAIGVQQRDKVVIASPDKDLRQCLVAGEVTILKGFGTAGGKLQLPEWYAASDLAKDFGLRPDQWVEFQCLVGDGGDDIKGCPGWGPVTAAAALVKCGTLEACWCNPWAVPCLPKQRDALLVFRKRVDVVRQLVTLRTDVAEVYDALR